MLADWLEKRENANDVSVAKGVHLSEGLALGTVTGLGYFAAYLSDSAYKAYFGLPSLYADISLNVIVLSMSCIVAVGLLFWVFTQYAELRRVGKYLLPILLPLAVGLMLGLKLDFQVKQSLLMFCFYLLLYIFFTTVLFILAVHKRWVWAGLVFVVIVVSISRASGYLIASNQVEYLVAQEGNTTYVVVDVYKDAFIMMPVDLEKRTVKPEYRFVDQKKELKEATRLKKQRIGPLTLQQ
ncbi:hypothetical protein [Laceyella putida]|uniref:Uncharacterized protein n=1 Tax=Laceyella putida TaxID=110101 RepID=A0ABW2RI93_9BACL